MRSSVRRATGLLSRRRALGLALGAALAAVVIGATGNPLTPPRAEASNWCWCTDYVKNRFGLTGASGDARVMGSYLQSKGFRQIGWPQPGAVIIFQPSFGPGIDQAHGHVGVINSTWKSNNNQNWNVNVRGANQGGGWFTDANCYDVSDVTYKSYPWWSSSVSYYIR